MKVTTDACLFGAWCAEEIQSDKLQKANTSLLDIGTGTGLLSLMIAQKNKCTIDAVEIEKEAAQQAIENASASPWKQLIDVHHGDVLNFPGRSFYDIIISNPPFYEREIVSTDNQKNKAHHGDGLKLSELASFINSHLASAGSFYLLLPFKRKSEVEIILKKQGLFIQKRIIVSPSPGSSPLRLMIKGSHEPDAMKEEQIFIANAQKQYTPTFISLLKDYYLYL